MDQAGENDDGAGDGVLGQDGVELVAPVCTVSYLLSLNLYILDISFIFYTNFIGCCKQLCASGGAGYKCFK